MHRWRQYWLVLWVCAELLWDHYLLDSDLAGCAQVIIINNKNSGMSRQTSPSAKSVTWGGVNYKEYDTHERIISNRRSLLSPEDEPERGKDFHYDLRYRSPPRYTEEESMRMIDELNSHHSHSRSKTPLTQGSKKAATRRTKSKGKKEDKK